MVVPSRGRDYMLAVLHIGDPGVSRMKALESSVVCWPGFDGMGEDVVNIFLEYQQAQPLITSAVMQPWSWPTRPCFRLHVDFAGPLEGRMFLIVVDAHSMRLDVIPMKTATALTTVQTLRTLFSRFGVPELSVSDNDPQFAAAKFQELCRRNVIRHILIAPYHPAPNGLAERGLQSFKRGYKKFSEGTVEDHVVRFVLQYAITPHTTTGRCPSELLFGRKLCTHPDTVKPDIGKSVEEKQSLQKKNHDLKARTRNLSIGDKVFIQNFRRGKPWPLGIILRRAGPLLFMVGITNGQVFCRPLNLLHTRIVEVPPEEQDLGR